MPRWGTTQDLHLVELVRDGSINPREENLDQLHTYNTDYFSEFIAPGKRGRESAISRIHTKLRQIVNGEELAGLRCRNSEY